ncbi:MAG: response regulator [Leptospiraceae bacterium]|nr:response regulator [Leptospiraceae bacterium]
MTKNENISILYVDDEPINEFLFRSIFEHDYNIYTATSGKEGLEILNKNKIHIVISDFLMPEMNGIDFIKKAKSKFSNISYYILSACEKNKEISEAIETKLIEKYFAKPFKAKEIEEAIFSKINNFN